MADAEKITVVAEAVNPSAFPYAAFDSLKLNDYKIVDSNGKTVIDSLPTEMFDYADGKAEMTVPYQNLDNGDYKLIIRSFTAASNGIQSIIKCPLWQHKRPTPRVRQKAFPRHLP